jgi:predicted nucleic acid-binding protein
VEDDVNHEVARRFLSQLASGKHGVSVTTDYVLDETLTLLRSRRGLDAAITFVGKIRNSKSVRVFWIDESIFEKALEGFRASKRKSWSFTDCTSFALMKELSVAQAFAFDKHFEEAGLGACP